MIMTIFTPQQKRVLNTIKVFQAEYQGGVPYKILKLDLDIPEEDLTSILGYLEEDEYISRQDGNILLTKRETDEKGVNVSQETQSKETLKETVDDNIPESSLNDKVDERNVNVGNVEKTEYDGAIEEVDVKKELSENEKLALEIIRKVVDESGNISRTLLEGTLLYGELGLSNIRMYNLVTSLEYKGILKKITLTDGEYYHFTP